MSIVIYPWRALRPGRSHEVEQRKFDLVDIHLSNGWLRRRVDDDLDASAGRLTHEGCEVRNQRYQIVSFDLELLPARKCQQPLCQ